VTLLAPVLVGGGRSKGEWAMMFDQEMIMTSCVDGRVVCSIANSGIPRLL